MKNNIENNIENVQSFHKALSLYIMLYNKVGRTAKENQGLSVLENRHPEFIKYSEFTLAEVKRNNTKRKLNRLAFEKSDGLYLNIRRGLLQRVKVGGTYTDKSIRALLSFLYIKYGSVRKAKASDLYEFISEVEQKRVYFNGKRTRASCIVAV